MRIDFRVDGGLAAFPARSKTVSIDSAALPPAQTARLRDLVERAGFFALPAGHGPAAPLPDARAYRIDIADGARRHCLTVSEPIASDALRALVAELRQHADRQRGLG